MAAESLGSRGSAMVLSVAARLLMGIPFDAELPTDLGDLYDNWFAGRAYDIDPFGGWSFEPRGQTLSTSGDRRLDCCLDHRTAQFCFGLDNELGVHVLCNDWVQIASSFTKLVELDAIRAATNGHRPPDVHPLGRYSSFEAFRASNSRLLARLREVDVDPGYAAAFIGDESLVFAGRFYSDAYAIGAHEVMRGIGSPGSHGS